MFKKLSPVFWNSGFCFFQSERVMHNSPLYSTLLLIASAMSGWSARGRWEFEYIKFRTQDTHVYPPDVHMAGGDDMETEFGKLELLHTGFLCFFDLGEDRNQWMVSLMGRLSWPEGKAVKVTAGLNQQLCHSCGTVGPYLTPYHLGTDAALQTIKGANYFHIFTYLDLLSSYNWNSFKFLLPTPHFNQRTPY